VDVQHFYNGLLFEWDRDKARSNFKKHGVSFEEACEVFFDPLLQLWDAGDKEELTQAAIGETELEHLLYVVHIVRAGDVIRIISARAVTAEERREYEE
jgi:uncharacterized DUF497 family protein